jgi:bacillithiol synthase
MKWTVRVEPSGNPLTDAHVSSFESVARLYDHQHPGRLETYTARAHFLSEQFTLDHRKALVDALTPFMKRIGASEKSFRALERLQDERSVAVVTGQQAGLFTGPMYSLYKALSAIGLAERLERDLARPVVPVFWVASEDHDWAEVNHAYILDGRDDVKRLQLQESVPLHQMMYHTCPSPSAVEHVLKTVHEWIPEGEHKSEMMDTLLSCYSPGDSMSTWFGRILVRLLQNHGLVVLDPCLPELRALVAPVWAHTLRHQDEVKRCLDEAYSEVASGGFKAEVVRDESNTTMFYVTEGKRYVMETTETGAIRVRGLGIEKSVDEWVEIAEREPSYFSSNVLLRPVVQDFLLPTLLYIGGPSELAYYPLSRGVFHAHGRKLPPLLLRQRMTLYPPSVRRNMKKWKLGLDEVFEPKDLVSPVLYEMGADVIEDEIIRHESLIIERWNDWIDKFAHLGPQVKDMVALQVQRDLAGLQRLGQKTRKLLELKHEAEVKQLRHIERWLWTDGHPQERRLCPLSIWAELGLKWFSQLPCWSDYEHEGAVYHVEIE